MWSRYVGTDGSCGFMVGHKYDIETSIDGKQNWIIVRAKALPNLVCPYNSVELFLQNWEPISFKGKPETPNKVSQGYVDDKVLSGQKDIVDKITAVYRDVCIAENAYRHDVGGWNGNFEQRRIAIDDICTALGVVQDLREIDYEVAQQVWTRGLHSDGRIKYERIK